MKQTEAKSTYDLLCARCARNLPWKYWNHFVSYSPHCNSVLLRWHCKTLRTNYSSIDLQTNLTNLWTTLFIWLFISNCFAPQWFHDTGLHYITLSFFFFLLLFMIRWLTSVHLTPSGYLPPRVSESRNVAAVLFFKCGIVRGDTIQQLQQQQKELEGCIRICESPCLWLISQSS